MDLAAELPSCSDTDELQVAKESPADASNYAALFPRLPRRRLRRAAEREHAACHGVDAARWQAEYPPPSAVPLDGEGFAVGFPCPASPEAAAAGLAAEAVAFYRTHGYVVFAGALSAEECAASRAEIWDALEAATPGVRRGELASYSLLNSATYGLAPVPAVFSRQLLANRQSPRVVAALAALLDVDARLSARPRDGLLVSHDRWCFYRPTAGHPEWRTRENLHLDLHPWSFRAAAPPHREALEALAFESPRDFACENNWVAADTGPHLQGVVALADNADADGGTQLVPGFPARFNAWADALGDAARHSDAAARAAALAGDPTRPWLIPRDYGGGSLKWSPEDPVCSLARRVPLREGAFLVWDQRMAHGAKGNVSHTPRFAQFIKAFRAEHVSDARACARAAAVARGAAAGGCAEVITPLGRRVFGMDWVV